jgi:hypothetical protein
MSRPGLEAERDAPRWDPYDAEAVDDLHSSREPEVQRRLRAEPGLIDLARLEIRIAVEELLARTPTAAQQAAVQEAVDACPTLAIELLEGD